MSLRPTLCPILGLMLLEHASPLGLEQERPATPAVVNPVLRSTLRPTLSLDGDWDFTTETFTWVAGMGYVSEPTGKFTLFLGKQPLLELDVTQKTRTWKSADGDVALRYAVKSAEGLDSSGLMQLSLPLPC